MTSKSYEAVVLDIGGASSVDPYMVDMMKREVHSHGSSSKGRKPRKKVGRSEPMRFEQWEVDN